MIALLQAATGAPAELRPGSPTLAFVGAALVLTGVAVAPFATFLARRIFPGRNVFFARWGFTHLGRVVLLFLALAIALELVFPSEPEAGLDRDLWRSALAFAGAAALALRFARRLSPEGLAAMGLRRGGNARALAAGLAAYLLLLPAILGLGLAWPWVIERLGGSWEKQDALQGFLELEGGALWLGLFLGVIVMPLLEELLFRGFLQPLLVQNFRDKGGVLLTSLAFAALHGTNAFLPIFGLSLVLGSVMLRTQRLFAAFALHALHNGSMLALVLFSKQMQELLDGGAPGILLGLFP